MSASEEAFDVPEPEETLPDKPAVDVNEVDPGGAVPDPPPKQLALGEDPAYDPGGMGRQPDIAEDAEDYVSA